MEPNNAINNDDMLFVKRDLKFQSKTTDDTNNKYDKKHVVFEFW